MSDVLGRGVIELVADARQLQAGIADAKKSIRTLGEGQKDISKGASDSIDRYISRLQVQQKTLGMSTRETELYKLAVRGASNEQIKLADTTIRMTEAYERGAAIGDQIKSGLLTIGAAAATGLIAAFVAFDQLVKKAGDFQDMAEKTGDTAANFASLAVAARVGGVDMNDLVGAANSLTKNLSGVDDESKAAGAAVKALGLSLNDFKKQAPAERFETIAKALDGFAEGSGKSAVAVALLGKSGAEMLPFFKELSGETGRQNILTSEQIALADDYADKQARLGAQISMHAQGIATELLPAYADLTGAFLDVIKGVAGVSDGTHTLANDRGIQDFADKAVYSIAFIVDSVDGLIRVFQIAGKAIAGAAAIAVNPIQQSKAIFQAMSADIEQTMNRPWMRDAVEKRQADRKSSDATKTQSGDPAAAPKPDLKYAGPVTKKTGGGGSGNQEARAQLAADLDQIKKAGEAQINTFANAEKIMEAQRSAGLLNEREYYAAKLSFLNLTTSQQEQTLQAEIARLESEKATGKERIDNQRKIAEAQAQISKIRENATANTEILSIQEVAANEKIAKSYIDATIAAEAYIKTIVDRNAREIAAVGKGAKNRGEMEGRNQIEDKFTGQRQVLERDLRNNQITQKQFDDYLAVAQDTYAKEVALYDDRTAALNAMEGDWVNGASEAFNNYMDEVNNVAKRTEDAFSDAFKSTERAMSDFLFDPFENGVNGMLKSLGTALKRIVADFVAADLNKRLVGSLGSIGSSGGAGGLAGMLAGLFGGGSSGSTDVAAMAGVFTGRARGGPVSAGNMYRVNEKRPELLNIAGEQYLMMGSQSGSVDPNVGGGPSMSNVINIHMPAGSPAENRRAAGQGAREAMAAISSAGRYR